jgi:ParB family transcriptional regulator, chromosome partitioning protein
MNDASQPTMDIYGRTTDFVKTQEIDLSAIRPNPHQPRKVMSEERLVDLTNSIRTLGLINPITVMKTDEVEERPDGGRMQLYILIAGQRRLEAFRRLGKSKITATIKDEDNGIHIAIAENTERENLNPIDEAEAYQRAMQDKGYTQEELAERLGKSRPSIVDIIALNQLPDYIKEAARTSDRLTKSALVELVRTRDDAERQKLWERYQAGEISVRAAKRLKQQGDIKTAQTPGRKLISTARSLVKRLETVDHDYLEKNAEERDELFALYRQVTDLFKDLRGTSRRPRQTSDTAHAGDALD